jgi:tRNA(Ile)-lysidine synthase
MSQALLEKVRSTIAAYALISPGERVLVGVSGGADSVALLLVLSDLGYDVCVGHVNHGARGEESDADAAFVADLAASLGLPYRVRTLALRVDGDLPAGVSFEHFARRLRYTCLMEQARELGCRTVAVGHHLDDQAETVLLRLLRGEHPSAWAGIRPVRHVGEIRVVRPLLACRRQELREYLQDRGAAWREDSSNEDTRHLRNRIRHELMPLLTARFNPGLVEHLGAVAGVMQAWENVQASALEGLYAAVRHASRPALRWDAWVALAPFWRRQVLAYFLAAHGVNLGVGRLEGAYCFAMAAQTGRRYSLAPNAWLYRARTELWFVEETERAPEPQPLAVPDTVVWGNRVVSTRVVHREAIGDPRAWCGPQRQVFDRDRLKQDLWVRSWKPGDRFEPLGCGGTRKVQDVFVDRGVPVPLRRWIPLIYDGDTLLWIAGVQRSAHAPVTDQTKTCLVVEVRDAFSA